jgi:hypothetical protein
MAQQQLMDSDAPAVSNIYRTLGFGRAAGRVTAAAFRSLPSPHDLQATPSGADVNLIEHPQLGDPGSL